MIIVERIKEAGEITEAWRKQGFSIGFVPTMGYLHDGHRSLMEKARAENDKVVVSIFINPIQFGPNEDFEKYPKDFEHDREICKGAGTDLIFVPAASEMYPSRNLAYVDIEELGDGLCGAKRSGHFRGVCTVVSKLFNIITPHSAYFGEKDAQQLAIIKRMTQDLNFGVRIVSCPIVREPDGLAMSSRNSYLSPEERNSALVISRSLSLAQEALSSGERDTNAIRNMIIDKISCEPLARIDYIDIVDASSLKPKKWVDGPVLVAAAVFIGKTRLIDNFTFQGGFK